MARRTFLAIGSGIAVILLLTGLVCTAAGQDKTWSVKADYIEACSCHLFCSCYFNTAPEDGMMCKFNNAVKIAEGHVGDVKVDGLKFWISGDLGGDFTKGMKTAIITLEPGTSNKEEEAIKFLVGKIYPVKWKKVEADHAQIKWEQTGTKGHAVLGNGQGEVVLEGVTDSDGQQSVLRNVKYWGAQTNTGFYLAKSTHHYKGHGYDYSLKDRNGFFIHIESSGGI
jgi:hypothetical protein